MINMFEDIENLKLTENVNLEVAEKLNKINYSQFLELFNMSTTKRAKKYDIKGEYNKLKNYINNILNKQNTVKYKFSDNKTIGRLQAIGPSLQRLYNGYRGVLCDGYIIDIDICNAHPTFLVNLCKKHNIPYNYLHDYINNREAKINETMELYNLNRGQVKSFFLSCINDVNIKSKIENKRIKKSFIQLFNIEIVNIIKKLYSIYKDDLYYSTNFKENKDSDYPNTEGRFINLILCDIENKTLQKAINSCINNNLFQRYHVSCLMYDGFMLNSDNIDSKNIINHLNDEFKNENIKWSIKPHNTELLEKINNYNYSTDYEGDDIIEIVEYILNTELKDKLIKCDGSIYYLNKSKITSNEKLIKSELYKFISSKKYILNDGKKQIIISKNHNQIKNIVEALINNSDFDDNFLNNVWDYTHYKLFFNNGYFDFKLNKFIKGSNNRTFIKINKDFKQSNNPKLREKINKKIFYPIFTINDIKKDKIQVQLYNYFLYTTAKFIAGDVTRKRWTLFEGLRNSGKGIIGDILKNCFEKYVQTTNASNFSFKRGGGDSQKALSWLLDYRYSRIALTSEISIGDSEKLDGNMIKKFSSGGDCISARKNFQDEQEFKIQANLIICCNDLPKIEPNDALDFCDRFYMKSKFIDDDFNENNKIKGFSYYKKDDNLKIDFLKNEDVLNELINIFIESYYNKAIYPSELKKSDEEDNNEDNDYFKLNSIFKITNNEEDYISNEEIKNIKQNNNIKFSNIKIKKLLKIQGAKDYRSRKCRGLNYIKIINDNEEEGENEYEI